MFMRAHQHRWIHSTSSQSISLRSIIQLLTSRFRKWSLSSRFLI
jgi:hypothetical protein